MASFGTSPGATFWWETGDEPETAVDVLRGHGVKTAARPAATSDDIRVVADYERFLAGGVVSIAAIGAGMAFAGLLAMVLVSVAFGLVILALSVVATCVNACFLTPVRLTMTAEGVTFGYWGRTSTVATKSLVATHELRRNRYTIERRGARLRLARFGAEDDFVQQFVRRGIEIITT